MPTLSSRKLIHKAATRSDATVANPPGLRQRGGSWEVRVRVPDRLRKTLGKREIVRSLGGVSKMDAAHLAWGVRAEIAEIFKAAEVRLGLALPITQSAQANPRLTDQEKLDCQTAFKRDPRSASKRDPLFR